MNYRRITFARFSFILFVGYALLCQSCDTEGNLDPDYKNHFVRFFGDEGNQEGVDMIVEESDRSVILLGTTTVPGTLGRRIFLVKADWDGNLIWKKMLGGPYDVAKDIEHSNDGGFVILSQSSEDVQLSDGLGIKLITISSDGVKTDSVSYKSTAELSDFPSTVTPTQDGYIVTGSTQDVKQWANSETTFSDMVILRFSNQLDFDYDEHYSKESSNFGYKTIELGQSFFTFGSSNHSVSGNSNYNFYCFKTNDGGIQGEEFHIGDDITGSDEVLYSICPSLTSGGYFMAGTLTQGTTTKDIYIGFAYEDNGTLESLSQSSRAIKIPQNANRKITTTSVCQSHADPRGYLILGTEGDEGFRNIWLCKVNDIGSELYWSSIFGASDRNDDRGAAVAELPDGRILVVGTVNLGVNNLKMSLFKLNNQGKFAN